MKDEGLVDEIQPVPLEVLREFLNDDVEYVHPSPDWAYSVPVSGKISPLSSKAFIKLLSKGGPILSGRGALAVPYSRGRKQEGFTERQ